MVGYTFSPIGLNQNALGNQFARYQQFAGGVSQFGFKQVNAYTGYITGVGSFGQVNLFVNPSNIFGSAKQYLSYSGLDPQTAGEVLKIIETENKRNNKAKGLEIVKVIFEGIGKITDFVKAWKGQNGVAYDNTGWDSSTVDTSGLGDSGGTFPDVIPDTTKTTQGGQILGFSYTEVGIGVALAYLVLKK